MNHLEEIRASRNLPFLKRGMRLNMAGSWGRLVGGGTSGYLRVLFDGSKRVSNCHPTWEMTFYGDFGEVIANYKSTPFRDAYRYPISKEERP